MEDGEKNRYGREGSRREEAAWGRKTRHGHEEMRDSQGEGPRGRSAEGWRAGWCGLINCKSVPILSRAVGVSLSPTWSSDLGALGSGKLGGGVCLRGQSSAGRREQPREVRIWTGHPDSVKAGICSERWQRDNKLVSLPPNQGESSFTLLRPTTSSSPSMAWARERVFGCLKKKKAAAEGLGDFRASRQVTLGCNYALLCVWIQRGKENPVIHHFPICCSES